MGLTQQASGTTGFGPSALMVCHARSPCDNAFSRTSQSRNPSEKMRKYHLSPNARYRRSQNDHRIGIKHLTPLKFSYFHKSCFSNLDPLKGIDSDQDQIAISDHNTSRKLFLSGITQRVIKEKLNRYEHEKVLLGNANASSWEYRSCPQNCVGIATRQPLRRCKLGASISM